MWLHGDNTICNLPPRSVELTTPPAFFTGGVLQGECQHGNTVYLINMPGLVCNSCSGVMAAEEEARFGMCFECHAEGRTR